MFFLRSNIFVMSHLNKVFDSIFGLSSKFSSFQVLEKKTIAFNKPSRKFFIIKYTFKINSTFPEIFK